jgi:nifR3 family TIM-barrel protein
METDHNLGDTLSIGGVALDACAILAPLSGITDLGFRRIARKFGAGLVVSEMVACDAYLRGQDEARLRAEGEGVRPHVVQLAGCDPSWMAEAARLVEASGADLIDINMGCPSKRVIGGYAGSALMRDLDQALRITAAVVEAVSLPVTVKMRLGWDGQNLNAPALAQAAEATGAQAVTVHGRTRQQFYTGTADWAAIARVVEAVSIPVIANGDVTEIADARRCLSQSGAAAVMVGRAALGKPWLVGQIAAELAGRTAPAPSPAEMAAAAIEHYESLIATLGPKLGVRHARKHLAAYSETALGAGMGLTSIENRRLLTSEEPREVFHLLEHMFDGPMREAA